MKLFPKRLAALLLAAVMTLSLFPATGFAADKDAQEPEKDEPFYGYRATPHAGTHALTDAYLRGEGASVNYFNPGQPVNDLPAKYDSRDYGYITSVKNQNPYGSCWAHAAMASVESYMIKHGIPVGTGAAATTSLNLSETQHCFFTFAGAYDAEGMIEGDKATLQSDNCLDSGGNGELSAYTLMRWNGAADETVSALAYGSASSVAYNGLGSQYAYQYNDCHVQNTVWIPGTNVEAIKQAIMEYGAGNISYYEGSQGTYICNIPTSETYANHAITVVGWDDTIAVSKFRPDTPQNPGAWICKNSWGTGQFDNGYCYISYEDTTMNSDYIYFYDAEPIDNYEHNYQYDGTSNPVCYGVGWDNAVDYYKGFANDTQVANVFTAKGPEELKAIAFCSWDEDLSYTVEIYKNPTEGNPSSGTLMATKSGSVAFAGYYTIPLDSPVALTTGDTFSVVIKQSAPVADENGTYVHTPYDATFNNSQVVSWCAWTHVDHGPTSYYKEPGGTWKDCPENGDYRIKAFTDDVHFNIEAIANNDAWGSLTVDGTKIIAEPAEGYYVADYEVVSGTATATININTITVAPSSDCTIRVIFAPKPSFTVNFLASGTLEGQQTAQIYDVITLPSSVRLELLRLDRRPAGGGDHRQARDLLRTRRGLHGLRRHHPLRRLYPRGGGRCGSRLRAGQLAGGRRNIHPGGRQLHLRYHRLRRGQYDRLQQPLSDSRGCDDQQRRYLLRFRHQPAEGPLEGRGQRKRGLHLLQRGCLQVYGPGFLGISCAHCNSPPVELYDLRLPG